MTEDHGHYMDPAGEPVQPFSSCSGGSGEFTQLPDYHPPLLHHLKLLSIAQILAHLLTESPAQSSAQLPVQLEVSASAGPVSVSAVQENSFSCLPPLEGPRELLSRLLFKGSLLPSPVSAGGFEGSLQPSSVFAEGPVEQLQPSIIAEGSKEGFQHLVSADRSESAKPPPESPTAASTLCGPASFGPQHARMAHPCPVHLALLRPPTQRRRLL